MLLLRFSEAETNNVNARRQHDVNRKAAHYGAGVGTAPYYGVPGTDKKGYHNAHYAAPAYGAYGGYAGYGHNTGRYGGYNGAYHGAHFGGYNGGYSGPYQGAYQSYGYGHTAGLGATVY